MPTPPQSAAPAAVLAAYRDAARWYRAQSNRCPVFLAAIAERRVSVSQAHAADIGWAPEHDSALTDHLVRRGHRLAALRDAGLSVRRGPKHHDAIRNRVVFAYRDLAGQVLGFTARAVDPAATAKWVNTRNGVVFDKSRLLYGVHAIEPGTQAVAVVEGAWDAATVTAATAGRVVAVAACGTGFTAAHADVVSQLGLPVIVATDADPAGRAAAVRIHQVLVAAGVSGAAVLMLPDGADPSSWHTDGHDLPAALAGATGSLTEWVLDQHAEQLHPRHGPAAQLAILRNTIAPLLAGLPTDQRAAAITHLTAITGLMLLSVYEAVTTNTNLSVDHPAATPTPAEADGFDPARVGPRE